MLTLSDWKQVGKEMRNHVQEHGEGELPKHAYPLWLQMREILVNDSDFEGLVHETISIKSDQEAKPLNNPVLSYGANDKEPSFEILKRDLELGDDKDFNDFGFEEASKCGLPED